MSNVLFRMYSNGSIVTKEIYFWDADFKNCQHLLLMLWVIFMLYILNAICFVNCNYTKLIVVLDDVYIVDIILHSFLFACANFMGKANILETLDFVINGRL